MEGLRGELVSGSWTCQLDGPALYGKRERAPSLLVDVAWARAPPAPRLEPLTWDQAALLLLADGPVDVSIWTWGRWGCWST